jgi:hypothetical protein
MAPLGGRFSLDRPWVSWPTPLSTDVFNIVSVTKPEEGRVGDIVFRIGSDVIPFDVPEDNDFVLRSTQFGIGGGKENRFQGYIGEAIAFRRVLSDLEIQEITRRLEARWVNRLLSIEDRSAQRPVEDRHSPSNHWAETSMHLSISFPYPNPHTEVATVQLLSRAPGHIEVSVFDLRGRLVERVGKFHPTVGIPVSMQIGALLPSGLYILRATHAAGSNVALAVVKQ